MLPTITMIVNILIFFIFDIYLLHIIIPAMFAVVLGSFGGFLILHDFFGTGYRNAIFLSA